ncbi:hypothetical protein EON83_22505 [bacterium]|nr:MAG: hypothetical protein EON83_22505 [bacterium]
MKMIFSAKRKSSGQTPTWWGKKREKPLEFYHRSQASASKTGLLHALFSRFSNNRAQILVFDALRLCVEYIV